MAESYVTKFTRYVKNCKDNLYNTLKENKAQPTPNDTLSTLVGKVNNITAVYPTYPQYYERDPGLPNIDELFDSDPLRKVNGGEYQGCAYFICLLDENNKVGIYNMYNSGATVGADKIVISDGKTYENITATIKEAYEVQSNGIYTDSEGLKYCLIKWYKLVPSADDSVTKYGTPTNITEFIEDRITNVYSMTTATSISGVTDRSPKINYARYEMSNVTKNTNTGYTSPYIAASTIVINGICASNLSVYTNRLILNCSIQLASATTTSITIRQTSSSRLCEYIKLPSSDVPLSVIIDNIIVRELIMNDTITSMTFKGGPSSGYSFARELDKIYIGSGLSSYFTFYSSSTTYLDNMGFGIELKEVDLSENTFSANTSAITFNLSNCYLNKENVLNLFNKLADRTGKTTNILKLSTYSKSLVTDEEKAILTNKNWTIS